MVKPETLNGERGKNILHVKCCAHHRRSKIGMTCSLVVRLTSLGLWFFFFFALYFGPLSSRPINEFNRQGRHQLDTFTRNGSFTPWVLSERDGTPYSVNSVPPDQDQEPIWNGYVWFNTAFSFKTQTTNRQLFSWSLLLPNYVAFDLSSILRFKFKPPLPQWKDFRMTGRSRIVIP